MDNIFGKRLKAEREANKRKDAKWTQEFVADYIGVARPTYTAYENGTKFPPMETLNKIADLFKVDTDYLLGRTPIKKRPETSQYVPGKIENQNSEDATGSVVSMLDKLDEKTKKKMDFFKKLENDLGLDLTDLEVQKKLKRAAKIIFSEED
ncbi:helix-turn-helix domain-containing protein [Paenibacillus sp. USDA918EY]|uniref:helix-turn-helix domain-containing protein n=1 Tax=Paenibacillus sp. USDA918EY TaxID=2689575 RepID=UPI0013570703|nr:helix-turn-helix transcriptional regulator [Paenibacillus sp. USDA918EY]